MIRQGDGPPLLLLHGILGSHTMWRRVVPLVAPQHDTIALTALGHRGGPSPTERPVRIAQMVDDVERRLDELHVGRAHVAGNSMGGWIALELARRGRALSVCALSPAGCWHPHASDQSRPASILKATVRDARLGRPFLGLAARSAAIRRWALRAIAKYGERTTPAELVTLTDDLLACTVANNLLGAGDSVGALDAACPVTIAWSENDRILPLRVNGAIARELVPGARFVVLHDVGHVPMIDAPDVVADAILDATGARRA